MAFTPKEVELIAASAQAEAAAASDAAAVVPDLAYSTLAPTGDVTLPAGCGAYVPKCYEIASGYTLEIGLDAIFEVG